MSKLTIDAGTMYNLEKYCDLEMGVKEVCPELLEDHRIEELCYQLLHARHMLKHELLSRVVYEEGDDE